MKTLILYESKHGATLKAATYLNEHIEESDVFQPSSFDGDIERYDHIILASCVYMGQLHKNIKKLLEEQVKVLLSKPLTIVACAMNEDEFDTMIKANLSQDVIKHANIVHAGGAYNFDSMNFLERFVVKRLAKVNTSLDQIKYNTLDAIIKTVNP